MILFKQLFICLIILNYNSDCARIYGVAKGTVKFLEKIPAISKDPITELAAPLDKVYNVIGIRKILNGNSTTNRGRVTSPVRASRPSIQDVKYYYHYVLAVHCESSLERWDCHFCKILGRHVKLVKLFYDSQYQTKAMLTVDQTKKAFVIIFRSSYSVGSTLTSFLVGLEQPDPKMDIKIHQGSLKSVEAVYVEIVKTLRFWTDLHPTYKVVVGGHSLGSQQASVLVFLLKYRNEFPKTAFELYTYGQPRTGNKGFADFMNNLSIPIARVVNARDIAVRLNPAALGYYHHQNELLVTDDGYGNVTARYCSTEFYEDPKCAQAAGLSRLAAIEHIVYFGVDPGTCLLENPIEYLLQAVWPLRPFLPKALLEQIPTFAINTSFILDYRHLVTAGIRNLYKVAAKSSTYAK